MFMRGAKIWRRVAVVAVTLAVGMTAVIGIAVWRHGPLPMERAEALSAVVLDRDGALLRAYTASDGRWRMPVAIKDVDPTYLKMLLAFEDRRFRWHPGVDPVAVMRAGMQALRHRRLVSGSSTLTMQVARLLDGRHEKTAGGKFRQMVRALVMERQFSKDEVLALYLRLAPFGGNLEGVRAASLAYFGKEPHRLSHGEAALLVAIPQSPEARRPDVSPGAAKRARARVIKHAMRMGVLTTAEGLAARAEPMPGSRRSFAMAAPHLSDDAVAAAPAQREHRLTIDGRVQRLLETAARDHAVALGSGISAAVLVVEHDRGTVVAHVGSAGYLDMGRAGGVDMTGAVRSPGSTLKPLIYALGFDGGLIHPNTLIEDRPQQFGGYRPKNFDKDWHGTVTIREALAQSLNIPAVAVLDAVGPERLMGRLAQVGIAPELPDGAAANLSIALGGVGMRLTDLAQIYAGIARGGEVRPLQWRVDDGADARADAAHDAKVLPRLMSPVAAWYVGDILKHAPAPQYALPGQIAYKTGTSYGNRDAWSVGYDGRHTIAVWVGRPDGQPVTGLSGRVSAAPLLFDAFRRLSAARVALAPAPFGAVRATGDALPAPLRRFSGGGLDQQPVMRGGFIERPLRIAFPLDRAVLDADSAETDGVVVKVEGGAMPLTWLVDGAPVTTTDGRSRELVLAAPGRGFVRITVMDALGRAERVVVRLK